MASNNLTEWEQQNSLKFVPVKIKVLNFFLKHNPLPVNLIMKGKTLPQEKTKFLEFNLTPVLSRTFT